MQRPGVISWPLLAPSLDRLPHYLLLYDELWVPGFDDTYPTNEDIELHEISPAAADAVRKLAAEGLIRAPRIKIGASRPDTVVRALKRLFKDSEKVFDKAFPTAERAALEAGAATFNMDIALSRLITYVLWRDHQKPAYPVAFPFGSVKGVPAEINETHGVLSILIKRFPAPRPDLPIQDLIAFKRDSDTQIKFQRLWSWARKIARESGNTLEIEEELDSLLREYSVHLKQLHTQTRIEVVEIILSTPGDVVEDLLKLRFGSLFKRLLQFRKAKVNANASELGLPGNDVAYLTHATRLLSGSRPRS